MGLFAQLKRSRKKTKIMNDVIYALRDIHNKPLVDKAIMDFYYLISTDILLGPIIKKYDADYELLKYLILELNLACGGEYGGWIRGQFLPVYSFGFTQSLEYALSEYRAGASITSIWYGLQQLM